MKSTDVMIYRKSENIFKVRQIVKSPEKENTMFGKAYTAASLEL